MREIIDMLNQLNEYVDSTGKYLKPPSSTTPPPPPPKNTDSGGGDGGQDPINEIKNFLKTKGYRVQDVKLQAHDHQEGTKAISKFVAAKTITEGQYRRQVHELDFIIYQYFWNARPRNDREWQEQLKKERPSTGVNWADDLLGMSGNDTIIGTHADRESNEFIQSIESLVAQANGQSYY